MAIAPGRHKRRIGFTLVEMLVVISIIAVLAALLLPAINMARESARRAQCSNNLKNLHLAMQQFDNARSQYPASRTFWNAAPATYKASANWPTNWNASNATNQTLTWVHEILPYLEQQTLREYVEAALINGNPVRSVGGKISVVFCPSDDIDDDPTISGPPPQLSYGVNSGVPDVAPTSATSYDHQANGVFDNRMKGGTQSPPTGDYAPTVNLKMNKTSLADVTRNDGSANTILVVENSDLENWNYAPTEVHAGVIWDYDISSGSPSPNQLINKYPGGEKFKPDTFEVMIAKNMNLIPYARPLSNHPTGFMAVFCDGHNKFINEAISYDTYARIMTSNGKKYLPAGSATLPPAYAPIRQMQLQPITDDQY
jgi:prepilin-type N-terminal cleavage/methylation domain-containing protein